MLELTPVAREKIQASLERAAPPRDHLRIEARPGGQGFQYRLAAMAADEVRDDDFVLEEVGFRIVLDPESAGWLRGARLDYRETLLESGFRFENPNPLPSPTIPSGARADLTGTTAEKIRRLLDTEINPAVAAHGGRVELAGVEDGVVYLSFGGGCHGCGLVDVTLKQGIETRLKELLPEIEQVVDTTDHAAGANPFYR
ncbi:MAG TPA: iron-sulfur cluster assembly accessory protein [Gemmatimonadota bacterium]|nr:iron-sulfur cluster assembly accessory protein [Gemmatimonadota bacterium]